MYVIISKIQLFSTLGQAERRVVHIILLLDLNYNNFQLFDETNKCTVIELYFDEPLFD